LEFKLKKEIFFGFFIGVISNIIGVFLCVIILFKEYQLSNILDIINNSIDNNNITKLISLGAIVNLISFFILLKFNFNEKARGVLVATFVIAILTIYLNNF
jgi:predicted neutral ceramidase superfamily lipid hydrolase